MSIEKIIDLGNRAKAISGGEDYSLANVAFAVVLRYHFERGFDRVEIEIETQDPEGEFPGEAYYDLVVVRVGESSLCIPLPLLDLLVAVTVAKRGNFVPRGEHGRTYCDGSDEEKAVLWKELFAEVSRKEACFAVADMLRDGDKIVIPEAAI